MLDQMAQNEVYLQRNLGRQRKVNRLERGRNPDPDGGFLDGKFDRHAPAGTRDYGPSWRFD